MYLGTKRVAGGGEQCDVGRKGQHDGKVGGQCNACVSGLIHCRRARQGFDGGGGQCDIRGREVSGGAGIREAPGQKKCWSNKIFL